MSSPRRSRWLGSWVSGLRIDAEHLPAYLESSNPANNHRYQRYGFEAIGEFHPPGSDIPVTTMWRNAR